eukprot:1827794-Karenia_brevis.AAC.1
MTPNSTYLTCEALGFYNEELRMNSSRHLVFDLYDVKGGMQVNRDTSLSSGSFVAAGAPSSVTFANQVETAVYDTDTSENGSMPKLQRESSSSDHESYREDERQTDDDDFPTSQSQSSIDTASVSTDGTRYYPEDAFMSGSDTSQDIRDL